MSLSARALLAILLLAAVVNVQAQQPAGVERAPISDFSKVEIKTTRLAADFYTLEGQGGTISVLTGPDGVLLVDSQFAPLTDKLVAAIRKISDKPIRFLIDTHVHGDHTGGNENFAKLGVLNFSRDQLRARLEHPSAAPDGTPGKPAPPATTFLQWVTTIAASATRSWISTTVAASPAYSTDSVLRSVAPGPIRRSFRGMGLSPTAMG